MKKRVFMVVVGVLAAGCIGGSGGEQADGGACQAAVQEAIQATRSAIEAERVEGEATGRLKDALITDEVGAVSPATIELLTRAQLARAATGAAIDAASAAVKVAEAKCR